MEHLRQLAIGVLRFLFFLLLWTVSCAIAIGVTAPANAGLALVAGTVFTVAAWYGTRRPPTARVTTCLNIEISRQRLEQLIKSDASTIGIGKGKATASTVAKALSRPEAMKPLKDFQAHFTRDLVDELSDGKLDWNNENCELFFELMRDRHKLSSSVVIAALLYILDERRYTLYAETLEHLRGSDLATFAREAALSDLCCDHAFDRALLTRFAAACGLRVGGKKLEHRYWKEHRALRLSRLEANLSAPPQVARSIAEQIRDDAHRAVIDQTVSSHLDTERSHYIIAGPDYSRASRIDAYYRKNFSYLLSRAFDGHCCACGEGMTALQFDHFWCPKSAGGNFLMRSQVGLYVNNCIPLCGSCNARKGNRDFRDFFDSDVVEEVVRRSQSINAFVNEHMVDFFDPEFAARAVDNLDLKLVAYRASSDEEASATRRLEATEPAL